MHHFIFQPGLWIGEGSVTFSTSPEVLHFYTKWQAKELANGVIDCSQIVEMQGANEQVINRFLLSEIMPEAFAITLENDLIGEVRGTGVLDDQTIAWEFRGESGLEGFESFKLQENGEYMVHAEYASQDQFRSIIEGRIWKKE
jgi:hypothetical protein